MSVSRIPPSQADKVQDKIMSDSNLRLKLNEGLKETFVYHVVKATWRKERKVRLMFYIGTRCR
jgi:hypothetical protein